MKRAQGAIKHFANKRSGSAIAGDGNLDKGFQVQELRVSAVKINLFKRERGEPGGWILGLTTVLDWAAYNLHTNHSLIAGKLV